MPIIRSAIKKVRKDKKRTERNLKRKNALKDLIKKTRKERSDKALAAVFSALDKAVKVNLIHQNKSARLKSRLSKLVAQPSFADKSKSARLKSRLSKLVSKSASLTPKPKSSKTPKKR